MTLLTFSKNTDRAVPPKYNQFSLYIDTCNKLIYWVQKGEEAYAK